MRRIHTDRAIDCVAGALLVAATYIYFLLFAQFGFLHLMEQRLSADAWRPAMAAMGLFGLAAGFVTALLYKRLTSESWLRWAFSACALSAAGGLFCTSTQGFVTVAAAVGASIAVLTVTLAAGLRRFVPLGRLGLTVGFGTGIAYGVCNLPFLFAGSPEIKVIAVIAACGVGWLATSLVRRSRGAQHLRAEAQNHHPALPGSAHAGWGFVAITVSFLALIWLDSAAFLIIQETDAWKAHTWGTSGRQLVLGVCHFLAAIFAGWWIDRGAFRSLLLSAWALFVTAFLVLQQTQVLVDLTGPIYVLGISFYSTALVTFPSLAASHGRGLPRVWQAALLFGIAGWIGSALGVGMAQDLNHIPGLFLIATGVAILATAVAGPWRRTAVLPPWLRRRAGYFVPSLLLTGLLVAVSATSEPTLATHSSPAQEQNPEAMGRLIYIREGCIHCHSQYVRPTGDDLSRYGPHRPIDRSDNPVLIGNRRQGPDLTWAGRFRDTEWLTRHLIDPKSTSPGSRMPSYAHLFVEDGPGLSDGELLVAYLASKTGPSHGIGRSEDTTGPTR